MHRYKASCALAPNNHTVYRFPLTSRGGSSWHTLRSPWTHYYTATQNPPVINWHDADATKNTALPHRLYHGAPRVSSCTSYFVLRQRLALTAAHQWLHNTCILIPTRSCVLSGFGEFGQPANDPHHRNWRRSETICPNSSRPHRLVLYELTLYMVYTYCSNCVRTILINFSLKICTHLRLYECVAVCPHGFFLCVSVYSPNHECTNTNICSVLLLFSSSPDRQSSEHALQLDGVGLLFFTTRHAVDDASDRKVVGIMRRIK